MPWTSRAPRGTPGSGARAQAAGGGDVVLFADPANPTSNALYQRIGYVPVTDFAVYDVSRAAGSQSGPVIVDRS